MKFFGNIADLTYGIEQVLKLMKVTIQDEIQVEKVKADAVICISIQRGQVNKIAYKEKHHFFRALSLYIQKLKQEQSFKYEEQVCIQYCGAMVDVSRNSVYKVEQIKQLINYFALMGQNYFMLYTEDTYEIPEYPYFGYLRGRYTKEELKEIDQHGLKLGIEVIPCIQTLAHLHQTLHWQYAYEMRDTENTLLVGEEETYAFIENMIRTTSEIFTSKRIHIGMDEAFGLGTGRYLMKNGYKEHTQIMLDHLARVKEIIDKYNLQAMIWDDMFFTMQSATHRYYDLETKISQEIADGIPENMGLVFWDYFHTNPKDYEIFFNQRQIFKNEVVFAGGVWKWMGFAPHHDRTFATTEAALGECKKHGIQRILATSWGDDGDETPLKTILIGNILFAEHAYHQKVDEAWLAQRCEAITGLTLDEFKSMQDLDLIEGVEKPNDKGANPSKYLLYQDVLLGAFDAHIETIDLEKYYTELAVKYEKIAMKSDAFKNIFNLYAALARVLSLKGNLGVKLRIAYKNGDKEILRHLANEIIPCVKEELTAFHHAMRKVWLEECKGHGLEVIDIRIGGVKGRLDTVVERINSYLSGEVSTIEELEETILPFRDFITRNDAIVSFNRYQRIVTQNVLSW